MSNFLTEILAYKRLEIEQQREVEPLARLQEKVRAAAPPLDFEAALRRPPRGRVALIAEIKKASPSQGLLCPDFDPARLAAAYVRAGATALSVLTDQKFFQGHLTYIEVAKAAAGRPAPVLRKDFLLDPYQVWQARAYGADAVLLIMAALDDALAAELFGLAGHLGMAALVEAHDPDEFDRAVRLGARLIGVNNRNLHTFEVSLATTEQLARRLPAGFDGVLVSESGMATAGDVRRVVGYGAGAVLVGETLVRAATTPQGLDTARIEQKIAELLELKED